MKKEAKNSCCCTQESFHGEFPGEPDEHFYNRRGLDKEEDHGSCLCQETGKECTFHDAPFAGETPELCEKSITSGMLQRHLPPKGKAGKVIVHKGKLFLIRDDSGERELVRSGSPAWIRPGEYHHLEVAGPVKFHVEFYTVPDAGEDFAAAPRPGEAFLQDTQGKR